MSGDHNKYAGGGPAFPINANESADRCIYIGMSLRDYFAAKAMQGIVSHPNSGGMTYEDISERAWMQADAMLKVRNQ